MDVVMCSSSTAGAPLGQIGCETRLGPGPVVRVPRGAVSRAGMHWKGRYIRGGPRSG